MWQQVQKMSVMLHDTDGSCCGWGHGGGQEEFGKTKPYKKSKKQRKVPDFLRNQELFGGDYWTRTSDLLRVKQAL